MREQPKDLFRRHDNCECVIIYDEKVLRGQKGENGRRGKKWTDSGERAERIKFAESQKPTVLSHDEAEKLQAELLPRRLTGGRKSGIISPRYYEDINAFSGSEKIEDVTKEKLQKELSVIPEQLLNELSGYVDHLYIGDNDCSSAFSPDTREIRLNPQTGDQSIIHELGHAFGEMIGAYSDPEFLSILSEGLPLDNWDEVIYDSGDNIHDSRIAYAIESPKFIRSYQGRIYPPNEDEIITDSAIRPEWLKEYISVGFDTYFRTPIILKEKDPKLYSYLEMKINERISKRI